MWNSNGHSNRSELESIQWAMLITAAIAIIGMIRNIILKERR